MSSKPAVMLGVFPFGTPPALAAPCSIMSRVGKAPCLAPPEAPATELPNPATAHAGALGAGSKVALTAVRKAEELSAL
jgi:hypothetical protein